MNKTWPAPELTAKVRDLSLISSRSGDCLGLLYAIDDFFGSFHTSDANIEGLIQLLIVVRRAQISEVEHGS